MKWKNAYVIGDLNYIKIPSKKTRMRHQQVNR